MTAGRTSGRSVHLQTPLRWDTFQTPPQRVALYCHPGGLAPPSQSRRDPSAQCFTPYFCPFLPVPPPPQAALAHARASPHQGVRRSSSSSAGGCKHSTEGLRCLWGSAGPGDSMAPVTGACRVKVASVKAVGRLDSLGGGCCGLCDKNPVRCKYFLGLVMLVSVPGSDLSSSLLICNTRNMGEGK